MDVQEILTHARDILTVKRVFDEPYEHDGMTMVPVARVTGGAGGDQGVQPDDKGGTGGGSASSWHQSGCT